MDATDHTDEPAAPRTRADSSFHGQVVVFAGKLASLGRQEARELVVKHGGVVVRDVTERTTMLVVGEGGAASSVPESGSRGAASSAKVRKAEQANVDTPGRVRILSEADFCRLSGRPSPATLDRQYHSTRQVRDRYPAVGEDYLRYLEKWSLVHPVGRAKAARYYGFQDLRVIRQVSEGLAEGAPFRVVLRALVSARDGQLTLDFSQRMAEAHPVKVVALTPHRDSEPGSRSMAEIVPSSSAHMSLAAKYFREGTGLDEGSEGDQEHARLAYRKALLLDPNLVPALVNFANLYYARDELVEAQALYERAMHLDGECFEAYFNLGNIHHDLGRYLDALEHYRVAIAINPEYADAHFYLAVTLEKIGHSTEAKAHWRTYRDLAPQGEWVELAREFSE